VIRLRSNERAEKINSWMRTVRRNTESTARRGEDDQESHDAPTTWGRTNESHAASLEESLGRSKQHRDQQGIRGGLTLPDRSTGPAFRRQRRACDAIGFPPC